MKMNFAKGAITSLVLVAAMSLTMAVSAATPPAAPDTEENISYTEYVSGLDLLTSAEKQELADALTKLDELYAKGGALATEGTSAETDQQIAALEARVMELENKAFPAEIEEAFDPAAEVNGMDLTDAEKQELIAAYQSGDETKICILELKAFANSITKLSGTESQKYRDAVEQAGKAANEMIIVLTNGADEARLNEASVKLETALEYMDQLAA